MEEDSLATTSTSEIWSREAGNKLANIREIVLNILKNLQFNDLLSCRQVCSLWREVAEETMKSRIFIMKTKMEFSNMRKSILCPEEMRPYLKLEGIKNVQLVSYCADYFPSCWLSATYKGLPVSTEWIDENAFDKNEKYEIFPNCHITVSCEVLVQTAIFPSVPGIEIHHFSYTPEEIHQCLTNGKLNLAEKIKVPEKELKCVLWFFGDVRETIFLNLIRDPQCQFTTCAYAMGGIPRFNLIELSRGVAFCGKRIMAASLKLCRNMTEHTGLPMDAKFSKQQIQNLKRYNINQKKCVGFLFMKPSYRESTVLVNFKEFFPDVPVFAYNCNWPMGITYMPAKDNASNTLMLETTECDNSNHTELCTFVLVWFN